MKKLENKIAVITGGNSGMGLATAQLFAQEGATVIVTARNAERLKESNELEKEGIHVIKADVSSKADLENLFAEVSNRFGKIDILFANAGIAKFAPFELQPDADVEAQLDVNIKGVFYTVQKASAYLNEGASVILNASAVSGKGEAGAVIYAATKAAVRSFARTFSLELGSRKIRVNAISPGLTETPLFGKLGLTAEQAQGFGEEAVKKVVSGRFANTAEIAKAALFLASTDSSYMVGAELVVDGGYSAI